METDKVTMRCKDGPVQLCRCPVCHYFVAEATEIVWRRKPKDMADDGEIESCIFCSKKNMAPEWATLTIAKIKERAVCIASASGCYDVTSMFPVVCKCKCGVGMICIGGGEIAYVTRFSEGVGTVYAIPEKIYKAQVKTVGIWLNAENFETLV